MVQQSIRQFNTPKLSSKVKLIQVNEPSGRYYHLPDSDSKLYSVTTVLSQTSDKTGLTEWRARVGEVAATKISQDATKLGTKLHHLMESLVNNQWEPEKVDPELLFRFQKVRSFLESEISELLGSELSVYSLKLGIAGTTDLVYTDHQQRIILADLKTSRTVKKREYIQDYFLQLAAYALCLFEQFQVQVSEGLILMSLPDGSIMKFTIDPLEYMPELLSRIKLFNSQIVA